MFWSEAKEPYRQFRWYIEFPNTSLGKLRYLLKKAAKPTIKIGEVTHKYLNHHYYYPGRIEWDPIQISFASGKLDNGVLANKILIDALVGSGYVYPASDGSGATPPAGAAGAAGSGAPGATGNNDLRTISKINAIRQLTGNGSMSKVTIHQINSDGISVEAWHLVNPFFTDIKYDSLEYASEEILNLDCTIRYDYATLGVDPTEGGELVPTTPPG